MWKVSIFPRHYIFATELDKYPVIVNSSRYMAQLWNVCQTVGRIYSFVLRKWLGIDTGIKVSFIVSLKTDVLRDVAVDAGFGTYSMDQSPSWEANLSSASQDIPHFLWNLKVHYGIHKLPPPDPILRKINPFHTCPSHLLKIYFNNILPSKLRSSKWSVYFRSPHHTPVCTSPVLNTFHPHLILHRLINRLIIFWDAISMW